MRATNNRSLVIGTSLQGEVDISYNDLIKLFGQPHEGDGYKVDAEWIIETPFGVATIYNYKTGKNYLGPDEGADVKDIRDWHIGGKEVTPFAYMVGYIKGKLPQFTTNFWRG